MENQDTLRPARGLIQGLGPIGTTALVAGNMIGSGIYVVPASLADIAGPVSLIGWGLVAIAFLCLTIVYADMGSAYPISGGMQVWAQRAFGDLAGLETAFLYWISMVIGNAAFLTAFVGYLGVFFPRCAQPLIAFAISQTLLWILTAVQIAGVRFGAIVQTVTTVLKIVPLVIVSIALFRSGSTANVHPFAPHGFAALLPAAALIGWLFTGSETVAVPAEEIQGAKKTIPRAALTGFGLAAAVYLLVALAVTFGAPASAIAGSASPLADLASSRLGSWGSAFVTCGALISVAGILNGSLLITGRLPWAAARQGLCPRFIGTLHEGTGTPVVSLLLSSLLTAVLALLYFSKSLLEAYNFIALASTAVALVAIGTACAAGMRLMRREPERFTRAQKRRGKLTAAVGLVSVALMIVGCGWWVGVLTVLCILVPVPYYVFLRMTRRAQTL